MATGFQPDDEKKTAKAASFGFHSKLKGAAAHMADGGMLDPLAAKPAVMGAPALPAAAATPTAAPAADGGWQARMDLKNAQTGASSIVASQSRTDAQTQVKSMTAPATPALAGAPPSPVAGIQPSTAATSALTTGAVGFKPSAAPVAAGLPGGLNTNGANKQMYDRMSAGVAPAGPDNSFKLADGGAPYVKGRKDGGRVVGPGTGTSDSVPAQYSNGEYVLPADTAAAIGHAKLDQIRAATHTPVAELAKGFAPKHFFANGGTAEDKRKTANSFGDAAAASQSAAVQQIPTAAPVPVQTIAPAQQAGSAPAAGNQPFFSEGGTVRYAQNSGFGNSVRPSAAPAPVTATNLNPPIPVGNSTAGAGRGSAADPRALGDPGTIAEQARGFAPAQPEKPQPSANPSNVTATRQPNGNMSFSGENVSGPVSYAGASGFKPGGFGVSTPGEAGEGRRVMEMNNRLADQMRADRESSAGPAGFSPPVALSSANDWQKRNDLRNLEVSASSITNQGTRRGPSAAQAAYQTALAQDTQARYGADAGSINAAKEFGDTKRANITALSAKYTADAHVKSQQATNGIAQRKLGLEEQKAATEQAQKEKLAQIDDLIINGDPAQRKIAAGQKAALMGKGMDEAGNAPAGYRKTEDGNLEFIKGGPADPNTKPAGGKPLNDTQAKALLFGSRMQAAGEALDELEQTGKQISTPGANGMIGPAVNLVNSKEGQRLDQSKRDFLNAVLRRESGAVIADTEFDNGNKQYFPQAGDSQEVITQKRDNRLLATRGILAEVPDAESRIAQVRGTPAPAKPSQQQPAAQAPAQLSELQRRAAANPALAQRLKEAGY
jgi:hypothetical protein